MRCESYTYKGFVVYHNPQSKDFSTPYITIVNPHMRLANGKCPHCHIVSGDVFAKRIIDCAIGIDKYGYSCKSRSIRNKAMRLQNIYIKSVH